MITRHMDVGTDEYLGLAKNELDSIDLENNDLIKGVYLYRAESVLNSHSPKEYHSKQEIYQLDKKIKKLNKKNKKLKEENKELKSENKKLKKKTEKISVKNKEILNSNSWKITKPLRKLIKFLK